MNQEKEESSSDNGSSEDKIVDNPSDDEKNESEDHEQGEKGDSNEVSNDGDHPKYDATLRAIMRTYPDTEVPDTFLYGYVTLRFNPDGSFLTKLNLNGLLPNCLNCGAHAHE